jgi:hypothetical protein
LIRLVGNRMRRRLWVVAQGEPSPCGKWLAPNVSRVSGQCPGGSYPNYFANDVNGIGRYEPRTDRDQDRAENDEGHIVSCGCDETSGCD